MDVRFKKKKTQKACETERERNKTFGQARAKKILRRLEVLEAADNLDQVSHVPPERCHQLGNDRDEEFAVDVEGQWRIIFEVNHVEIPRKPDGGIDKTKVTSILIIDICEDYH